MTTAITHAPNADACGHPNQLSLAMLDIAIVLHLSSLRNHNLMSKWDENTNLDELE